MQDQQKKFLSLPESICDPAGSLELFEQLLRGFGTARVRAQGTSMLPAICPGDELLIKSFDCNECAVGDVVAFRRDTRLFVHRVVESGNGRVVTQGDALSVPDMPVNAAEFLGKVSKIQRKGTSVNTRPSIAQRAAAAIFRRSRTCASLFQKFASL